MASTDKIVWTGVTEFIAALGGVMARVDVAQRQFVADTAHKVQAATVVNEPVVSGTLRRSVTVDGPNALGAHGWEALVGPTVIYGRRVELGFHGADSLGRVYDQAGHPALEPAVRDIVPDAAAAFRGIIAAAIAG